MAPYKPQPGTIPALAADILRGLEPGQSIPGPELAVRMGHPDINLGNVLASGRRHRYFIAAFGQPTGGTRSVLHWRLGSLDEQRDKAQEAQAESDDSDAPQVVINGGKGRPEPLVRHEVEEVWLSTSGEMRVLTRTEEFHFAPADARRLIEIIKAMPVELSA